MKIIVAGVGPGKEDLISLAAIKAAENSDLILIPEASHNSIGIAENLISRYVKDNEKEKKIRKIFFPMIRDTKRRDEIISEQIEKLKPEIKEIKEGKSTKIFFPVIGDSVLYSTGAYLVEELKKFFPEIQVEFIPGISAHSMAFACAKKFMAMGEDIFCVISGTADGGKILSALSSCNSAAIYKPVALKDEKVFDFIKANFSKIIRVDFAGMKNEKIFEGHEALENIDEYISIILLMRN